MEAYTLTLFYLMHFNITMKYALPIYPFKPCWIKIIKPNKQKSIKRLCWLKISDRPSTQLDSEIGTIEYLARYWRIRDLAWSNYKHLFWEYLILEQVKKYNSWKSTADKVHHVSSVVKHFFNDYKYFKFQTSERLRNFCQL